MTATAQEATPQRSALFVAAYDSQLKWCGRIRTELANRGFQTAVVVPEVRSALSPAQIRDAGFQDVETVSWQQVIERGAVSDVVVCSLSGPLARAFCIALADRTAAITGPPPVVVTGWVGVLIEKVVAGYLDRCGSDVVAVNAVSDLATFLDAAGRLDLPVDNLLLAGLPFLTSTPRPLQTGPVRRVLFADQPTVPSSERERLYVYRQLLHYAERHPEREVLLKPRHRKGEDTFHRMNHHPEDLLAGDTLPANFRFVYTPIAELVADVDLLLTLSSTACLEALDAGCRVGLILDLGVHERYGNHVFLDSGLLRTFAQIEEDQLGHPDPDWFASYFFSTTGSAAKRIGDRVEELLRTGDRPSQAVQRSAYFTSAVQAHRALAPDFGVPPTRARPYGAQALRRRQLRHGTVRGTLAHISSALVPPILSLSLRTLGHRAKLLSAGGRRPTR
ncbi:MAG TPA: DUF6716 putative glycosyltransferase [Propionibacteriaceae bacterium]|nr:DUF6716 putative glycosyltransferase [Propionibacteriaceae bacterium]